MTEGETEDRIPVPEYESKQYLPAGGMSGARRAVLVEKFGPVRTYFKSRPGAHVGLQRRLNQARFGTTYDIYLTRTVVYALVVGFAFAVAGIAVTAGLARVGALEGLQAPFAVSEGTLLWDLVVFVAANRVFFFGATITLSGMVTGVTVTWLTRYYYPFLLVDSRSRNIDVMLPHAIVYMYALSFGGMDFLTTLRRMAEAEDTYGEVANEFDTIVRDVEVFGNDLFTAIRNTRNLTASDNLEMFLDDLLSVLDSGGDVTAFLHDESEKYMQRSQEEQKQFLTTLAVLSEVFIVGFVAAPLFLFVTLIMMTFLGSAGFSMLFAIVYLVIPFGMLGFIVLVSTISEPYKPPMHNVTRETEPETLRDLLEAPGAEYDLVRRTRIRQWLDSIVSNPFRVFERKPELTCILSVPTVVVYLGLVWATAGAPTADQFTTVPFRTTVLYALVPFLLVTVPISVAHEYGRRHKRQVATRLPDALDILASSNQMGVQLADGLSLVARNVSGRFAVELQRVRNDIRWNYDIRGALLSLADRMEVPQLTRTCKILAEGSRSTGNLHQVIKIAAQDTRHRLQMERARQQELNSYVAVVLIGFLVYLGTLVVIDQSFLAPVIEQTAGVESEQLDELINVGAGTVSMYHMLFLHSALIQAIGTGLIVGELADNDVRTGLKYSIVLVLLAVVIFAVL